MDFLKLHRPHVQHRPLSCRVCFPKLAVCNWRVSNDLGLSGGGAVIDRPGRSCIFVSFIRAHLSYTSKNSTLNPTIFQWVFHTSVKNRPYFADLRPSSWTERLKFATGECQKLFGKQFLHPIQGLFNFHVNLNLSNCESLTVALNWSGSQRDGGNNMPQPLPKSLYVSSWYEAKCQTWKWFKRLMMHVSSYRDSHTHSNAWI